MRDNEEYKKKLREMLTPKRFEHSIGTAQTAARLAELNGEDRDRAYLAGLLHDAGKNFSHERMLEMCEEYGIELDEISRTSTGLIHAPLGAEIVRREFNIDDEEILESIRRHTVGGENMTVFEKIIYISDMTEPGRSFDGVEKIREAAFKNLDEGMLMGFDMTIIHSVKKRRCQHPATIYARNELIKKMAGQV
ncbi:MAG: bis(5'-nucleosyl)-tetraphosphatase (symmetrical) YqeK [Oscillospiraceae bacterium]|nr:bis(5'-nucleosyl)-tetraphosphatase (symmetrical) YqeK [Oscillospiraceae bacterium]